MNGHILLMIFLGLILVLSGTLFQSRNNLENEINGYKWRTLEELENMIQTQDTTQATTTESTTTQATTTEATTTEATTTEATTTEATTTGATTTGATTTGATTTVATTSGATTDKTNLKNDFKKDELNKYLETHTADDLFTIILNSSVDMSNEELYKKLLESNPEEEKNEDEESMREYNDKRQEFAKILLFDLVKKHKQLLKLLKDSFSREKNITVKLNKALTLNSMLERQIKEIKDKQEKLRLERNNLENLSSRYKVIKLEKDTISELKNMGLFENIPDELRTKINKNKVNIIKV